MPPHPRLGKRRRQLADEICIRCMILYATEAGGFSRESARPSDSSLRRNGGSPVRSWAVAGNSKSWQMSLAAAIVVWAAIVLLVAFWGIWLGFGGRRFAIA